MKKTILIVVLVIMALLSIVYASFQQTAANKSRIEAEQNLVLAQAAQAEAEKHAQEAKKVLLFSQQMAEKAEEELAKCKGKK